MINSNMLIIDIKTIKWVVIDNSTMLAAACYIDLFDIYSFFNIYTHILIYIYDIYKNVIHKMCIYDIYTFMCTLIIEMGSSRLCNVDTFIALLWTLHKLVLHEPCWGPHSLTAI